MNLQICYDACNLKLGSLNCDSCLIDLLHYGRDTWTITWNPVYCLLHLLTQFSMNPAFVNIYYPVVFLVFNSSIFTVHTIYCVFLVFVCVD